MALRRNIPTAPQTRPDPQHETVYTWNLAPSFSEQAFAFSAPPDAKPITFAEAGAPTLGVKVKKSGDKK